MPANLTHMDVVRQSRPIDSPLVESITLTQFTAAGQTLMQPDGCWDIAILNLGGGAFVLRTGLTTRPDIVEHKPGDEILTISFRPNSFMPLMPGEIMRNEGVVLDGFGRRDFWLGEGVREIPTLETADVFVDHLVRDEVVQTNPIVASIVEGHPQAMSERTAQRHFLRTTGLTYKHFTLIQRAQKAISLLRAGQRATDVAFALGYADQAHMINSLRQIMGQTPGQIAREVIG
jgi:Helix-turn-helix domain